MNKKIIGVFFLMLIMGSALQVVGTTIDKKNQLEIKKNHDEINSDELDQEQPIQTGNTFITREVFRAQSFIPTKHTLTRVELFIYKHGTMNADFKLSIRENLIGSDLTSALMQANQIPPNIQSQAWVDFNFLDIDVNPGSVYYIVCTTQGGNLDNCYVLGCANNNPYPQGDAWEYGAFNNYIWQKMEDLYGKPYDLCFRTYVEKSRFENSNILLIKILEQYINIFPILSKIL